MEAEQLSGDIVTMQKAKAEVCVSIIVPTHRNEPERKNDGIELKHAVEKATTLLEKQYPKSSVGKLLADVNELYSKASVDHHKDGVGIFVSPELKLLKEFPFSVSEKIIVGDTFEVRDLLVEVQYSTPYLVLLLTKKIAKLYHGEMDNLSENAGKGFPKEYMDDYEYNRPAPASSYSGRALEKAFEKDKSILEEIRIQRYLHEIDKSLDPYFVNNNTPLIVCGEVKELGYFNQESRHKKNIAGEVEGSYAYLNPKALADLVWPVMRDYLEKIEDKIITEFVENGPARAITGLENIWKAVVEGRAFKLVVERDFSVPAYVDTTGYNLYLQPPSEPHKKLNDAIDDLIEKTLETNGQVIFVQNDKLKKYNRVGLITRY